MTRAGSLIAGVLVAAVLAGGIGAWWLHGQLDRLVRRAIVHYGQQATQSRVALEAVEIRASDGTGVLRGLVVGNPAGFHTEHALKVARIEVAIDLRTLADPVVRVHRIAVEAPEVIYESGDGGSNFEVLQRHIARAVSAATGSDPAAAEATPPRRLVVDELVIRGARARASTAVLAGHTVSTTLPDIALRQVGHAQGGLTAAQLGDVVARALTQRLVARFSVVPAMKSLGDRVKGLFSH